jgi:hypothetical protein
MNRDVRSASSRPCPRNLRAKATPETRHGENPFPASDKASLQYGASFEVRLFLVAALLLTWIGVGGAEERESTNPHTTPEDVAAGGRIYRSHCIECHGRDGTGGRGPDITRGDLRYGISYAALDVHDGSLLWSRNLGGRVISSPITDLVDDKQHVSIISGHSLYTFVLKD